MSWRYNKLEKLEAKHKLGSVVDRRWQECLGTGDISIELAYQFHQCYPDFCECRQSSANFKEKASTHEISTTRGNTGENRNRTLTRS